MLTPEAFYDVIKIVERVAPEMEGISRFQLQRLAYLSCLLGIYDGRPATDWGYNFIRSDFGSPFSAALNQALDTLAETARIGVAKDGRYKLAANLAQLSIFMPARFHERNRYLDTACDSALFLPSSTISAGLDAEPTAKSAALQEIGRPLLTNSAQPLLYDHIKSLHQVFGVAPEDLLTPSMAWMTYAARQLSSNNDRSESA